MGLPSTLKNLSSDRIDGLRGLLDIGVNAGDDQEDNHREEGGSERGERILGTTVLGNLHNLGDNPADEIHPGHGGGERKATDDGVECLGLELLGDDIDGLEGAGNGGGHCI